MLFNTLRPDPVLGTYANSADPEIQIREGIEDNSKVIVSFFLKENVRCDPSLEPCR